MKHPAIVAREKRIMELTEELEAVRVELAKLQEVDPDVLALLDTGKKIRRTRKGGASPGSRPFSMETRFEWIRGAMRLGLRSPMDIYQHVHNRYDSRVSYHDVSNALNSPKSPFMVSRAGEWTEATESAA